MNAALSAGPTVIAAPNNTTSPLKIIGSGSNLADSRLLELTANGYRFAELGSAYNLSGWSGVIKVKTLAGITLGYILLHSNP